MQLYAQGTAPAVRRIATVLAAFALTLVFGAASSQATATFTNSFSNPTTGGATKQTVNVSSGTDSYDLTRIAITEDADVGISYPSVGSSSDQCPSSSMPTSSSAFDPSSCPSASKIGSITVDTGTYAATGNLHVINKTPWVWYGVDISPSTASGNPSGFTFRFAFTTTWVQVDPLCDPATDPSGYCETRMQLATTTFGSTTLKSASITFGGANRAGSSGTIPGALIQLPTDSDPCNPTLTTSAALRESDNSNRTLTDTDALLCQFYPYFNGTLSTTDAGQIAGSTFEFASPENGSNVKTIKILSDPRMAANTAALGGSSDMCPSSAMPTTTSTFNVSACPSQAKVGTITIDSPDYAGPATGDIWLIDKSASFSFWFAVNITPSTHTGNPSGLTLQFVFVSSLTKVNPSCDEATDPNGFCQYQSQMLSAGLPDVRLDSLSVDLNGPDRTGSSGTLSGKFLIIPTDDCETPMESKVTLTPFVGTPITYTGYTPITNCPS